MPRYAVANGLWLGPEPPELQDLIWIERKLVAQYRGYMAVARMRPEHGFKTFTKVYLAVGIQ